MVKSRLTRGAVAAVVLAAFVATASAQGFRRGGRGGRFFGEIRQPTPESFDGGFNFCRIMFPRDPSFYGYSGSWQVDYPRADINLSIRLSELTKTIISKDGEGQPNNLLMQLSSPEIFNCPFIMMTEVGAADLTDQEIANLRLYLLKGGFLWADDFWGTDAWEWWASVMHKILPPDQYPIIELTPSHPMYRAQFVVKDTPQIANILHWSRYGDGMERGNDSPRADPRAVLDGHGRIMVLMTHNTDFGDSFEREGDDPNYFLQNSVPGYAFGINALLYAMTH